VIRTPPCWHFPVYAVGMADDEAQPPGLGERAGAVLLVLLAVGLLFIGADIISGGKLTGRGCGCHDDAEPGD
jgi:hypothetical protein